MGPGIPKYPRRGAARRLTIPASGCAGAATALSSIPVSPPPHNSPMVGANGWLLRYPPSFHKFIVIILLRILSVGYYPHYYFFAKYALANGQVSRDWRPPRPRPISLHPWPRPLYETVRFAPPPPRRKKSPRNRTNSAHNLVPTAFGSRVPGRMRASAHSRRISPILALAGQSCGPCSPRRHRCHILLALRCERCGGSMVRC